MAAHSRSRLDAPALRAPQAPNLPVDALVSDVVPDLRAGEHRAAAGVLARHRHHRAHLLVRREAAGALDEAGLHGESYSIQARVLLGLYLRRQEISTHVRARAVAALISMRFLISALSDATRGPCATEEELSSLHSTLTKSVQFFTVWIFAFSPTPSPPDQ